MLSFATGILLDWGCTLTLPVWLGSALAALAVTGLLAVVGAGTSRTAMQFGSVLVLLAWVCVGGVRHHLEWSVRAEDNVSSFLTSDRSPARLVGRIETPLEIDAADRSGSAPTWTQIDRTLCLLRCERIGDSAHEQSVSGIVRLEVTGHLIGPRVGDELELFGVLQRPTGPRNPGGFDYATWLRRRGVDATIRVEHPDHARVVRSDYRWSDRLSQWRDSLRREIEWLCIQRLDYTAATLATPLLIGGRSGIDPEISDQFAASGTMHLLAISGLNVGILAGLVHLVCRLLKTSLPTTIGVLLVVVVGYALLTDQRPPVLRAAALAVIVLAGRAAGRDAGGYQSLALCALAILLFRPMDLFDPGAQLSFLAVLAIVWSGRWQRQRDARLAAAPALAEEPSALAGLASSLWAFIRQAYVMTAAIWLLTFPLTAWHFHLVSPVGLIINVLLLPMTTVMMGAGYAMMLLGLAHPLLAIPPAMLFSLLLGWLLRAVEVSAGTPLGHLYVPGPTGWWLCGFYLLAGITLGFLPSPWRGGWAWRAIALWCILGLMLPWLSSPGERSQGLRVTFLAVGHGCSVLIETPNGRTLLYDAGSFVDGMRAERTIAHAIWAHGRDRVDAALVSHADVDHFNGLPTLVGKLPVGAILLAASSLDFRQSAVVDLCEAAAEYDVPIRCVQAEDRLMLDPEVSLHILHPPADFRAGEDNANSLVLEIEYQGCRLMLTGDLEGAGLDRVLADPTSPVDVLMSPHHGSLDANPRTLPAWAKPRHVIVSTADAEIRDRLATQYDGQVALWSTANSGAVEVLIAADGTMQVTPFVP